MRIDLWETDIVTIINGTLRNCWFHKNDNDVFFIVGAKDDKGGEWEGKFIRVDEEQGIIYAEDITYPGCKIPGEILEWEVAFVNPKYID